MPSSIVLGAIFGDALLAAAALGSVGYAVASFAINMLVSSIITKSLAPSGPNFNDLQNNPNPGNRQQFPPATDNKLPVVYGSAYVGGIVTDLTISDDNQTMYYCIALSEVTNTENGATGDVFTFGDIYWGGKKCVFDVTDQAKVVSLLDESTNESQTNVNGNLYIYTFRNGSYTPTNGNQTAIALMSSDGLTYKWDNTKLMSNCAFAIVKVIYNQDANLVGLQQTKFVINNPRYAPGDCFRDYLLSTRYGAALPASQIDSTSLDALNTYCSGAFSYTTPSGSTEVQTRFRFDGTVDTAQTVMNCLQQMSASCDCLVRYNELEAKWGVIVQSPSYDVVMAINDSNMVSAIQINPTDLSSTPNIVETKFANSTEQDSFASAQFSLQQIAPSLLYPNEPVNKQTISLPLVNNDVRAQYIATRLLKASREDLIVKVNISYVGLQLEAGDIVTVTSANYGWSGKMFRISQVTQNITNDGQVTASLTLMEFNSSVYNDSPITKFKRASNTGIPTPLVFGSVIPVPTIVNLQPSAVVPSFGVSVTAASRGVSQYAEVWYSAFSNPSSSQRIFAGTTAVQPSGNPYKTGQSMGVVTLEGIPYGNWYFFVRMVNSIGTSQFSAASTVLNWRPTTIQYIERWVAVAYADNSTGTSGFSLNPRNKTYYGLLNNSTANGSANPADYTWYQGSFGSDNYLLIANRSNRKFSFAVGNAGFSNLGGSFVPTETSVYDTSVWGALEDGQNYIDLDQRTGQLTKAGSTAISAADGLLNVSNNTNGAMIVSLEKFLNFGSGVYQRTFNAATLTIDVYGRVVGYTEPDNFYYTEDIFTATAGQTTFSVSYTTNVLVFRDGILADTSEYSTTASSVILGSACAAGEIVIVIGMRAVSTSQYFENINAVISSSSSNSVVYTDPTYQTLAAGDLLCFAATQPQPSDTPVTYTVQSVNTATKTITFTTTISGAASGYGVFRKRAAGSTYAPFSRFSVDVSSINSYTPSNFTIRNGFEMIYVNGCQINEIDYDLSGNTINGFPAPVTGKITFVMFSENNFGVPASNVTNTPVYSTSGVLSYAFPNNPLAMEVYANGALLAKGSGNDYTATTAGYNLVTAFNNNETLLNQQTFARIDAA